MLAAKELAPSSLDEVNVPIWGYPLLRHLKGEFSGFLSYVDSRKKCLRLEMIS